MMDGAFTPTFDETGRSSSRWPGWRRSLRLPPPSSVESRSRRSRLQVEVSTGRAVSSRNGLTVESISEALRRLHDHGYVDDLVTVDSGLLNLTTGEVSRAQTNIA